MMGLGSTLPIHFNPGGLVGNKAAEERTTFSILVDEDVENEKKSVERISFWTEKIWKWM